jgi:O-antigen/teichoic acid export membrane protein
LDDEGKLVYEWRYEIYIYFSQFRGSEKSDSILRFPAPLTWGVSFFTLFVYIDQILKKKILTDKSLASNDLLSNWSYRNVLARIAWSVYSVCLSEITRRVKTFGHPDNILELPW